MGKKAQKKGKLCHIALRGTPVRMRMRTGMKMRIRIRCAIHHFTAARSAHFSILYRAERRGPANSII